MTNPGTSNGAPPTTASEQQLVERHRDIAHAIASNFYLQGADLQDVHQEALIGLLKGIRSHDGRDEVRSFLSLCVRRHLISAVLRHQRLRRGPLNDSIRVGVNDDGEYQEIVDLLPDRSADVVALVEAREELGRISRQMALLSPFEREALEVSINDESWSTRPGHKSIDNAVQRARRKLREAA